MISIMAQTALTIRLDSGLKTEFDSLCEEFGMSVNTAFNVFVRSVIRNRCIPFSITAGRRNVSLQDAKKAFNALRAEAQENGVADMTLDDINEEIRLARQERV